MNEIWKDIEGYDGEYQVSNLGRIKSVARLTTRPCQYGIREYRIPEKIMRTRLGTSGYLCVNLHHEGKQVTEMIHRLVALHFCKGYRDELVVNHKDEDKTNNRLENLEWMTRKENLNYGTHNRRISEAHSVRILCVELNREFDSIQSAAKEFGNCRGNIWRVLDNPNRTACGYHWKYVK